MSKKEEIVSVIKNSDKALNSQDICEVIYGRRDCTANISLALRVLTGNELVRYKVNGKNSYYYDLKERIEGYKEYVNVNTSGEMYDNIMKFVEENGTVSASDINKKFGNSASGYVDILVSQKKLIKRGKNFEVNKIVK